MSARDEHALMGASKIEKWSTPLRNEPFLGTSIKERKEAKKRLDRNRRKRLSKRNVK